MTTTEDEKLKDGTTSRDNTNEIPVQQHEDKPVELDRDGCTMAMCALRYAMGRHSYMTSTVAYYIRKHWNDTCMKQRRYVLYIDLQEYLNDYTPGMYAEGCDIDVETVWKPLLEFMKREGVQP